VIAAAVLNQGSARIPSQTYHDLSSPIVSKRSEVYRASGGAQVSLGIRNVFDKSPPLLATTGSTGTAAYSTYGDPACVPFISPSPGNSDACTPA